MIAAGHAGRASRGGRRVLRPWRGRPGLVWLLFLVAACAPNEPMFPELQPFQILDLPAWSGGEIRVTSAAFAALAATPTVLVSDAAAPVTRLDSVTVAVRLPVASGTLSLRVEAPGVDSLPQDIQLAGLDTTHPSEPQLVSLPEVWPAGSPVPTVVAITGGRLVQLDLRFGTTAQVLPESALDARCVTAPGLGVDPNVVVVATSSDSVCGALEAWAIRPNARLTDSGPAFGYVFPYQAAGPVLYLGSGRWLLSREHTDSIILATRDASGRYTYTGVPYGWSTAIRYRVSPRGDRALPTGGNGPAPVFGLPSGTVAYMIQGNAIGGAAFSQGGDTLFVSVDTGVEVRDATTGAQLGEISVPSYGIYDIVVDAGRPWLYVLVDYGSFPTVFVVDRRTLTIAGRLGINGGEVAPGWWRAVLSPAERRLYVMLPGYFPPSAISPWILRYSLLP
jgi:hypothetical protein